MCEFCASKNILAKERKIFFFESEKWWFLLEIEKWWVCLLVGVPGEMEAMSETNYPLVWHWILQRTMKARWWGGVDISNLLLCASHFLPPLIEFFSFSSQPREAPSLNHYIIEVTCPFVSMQDFSQDPAMSCEKSREPLYLSVLIIPSRAEDGIR